MKALVDNRSPVWMGIAAINGLIAVAAGAFGAHVLADRLEPRAVEVFELAARYQIYHALALLAAGGLGTVYPSRAATGSAAFLLAGMVVFSGSLYGLSLSGQKWLGAVTPVGGVCLMIGWLLLAVAAFAARTGPHRRPRNPSAPSMET
jgi:uncharacterized membrane protein YgdD (TMEM256/DUF423 family)